LSGDFESRFLELTMVVTVQARGVHKNRVVRPVGLPDDTLGKFSQAQFVGTCPSVTR
jgi:hypothetical protein